MKRLIIQISVPDYLVDGEGFITETAEIEIDDALMSVDGEIVLEDISRADHVR